MALDTGALYREIKRIQLFCQANYRTPESQLDAVDYFASQLASAINVFVRSGEVNVDINLGSTANGVTVGGASVPVTGTATGTVI